MEIRFAHAPKTTKIKVWCSAFPIGLAWIASGARAAVAAESAASVEQQLEAPLLKL